MSFLLYMRCIGVAWYGALGHVSPSTSNCLNFFQFTLRAAQILRETLYGCLSTRICSLCYFVSFYMRQIIFMPSVLWRCWLGGRKGILPVQTEWWDTGVGICLERGAIDFHMIQLMPLPPHHLLLQQNPEWFTFLAPAYPGCPWKKAVQRM